MQTDGRTGISFTRSEQQYVWENATGMWASCSSPVKGTKIIDLDPKSLHGVASYAMAAKMYDFCGRLLALQEDRVIDPIDKHYCYLSWISLLYVQRSDPDKLNKCEDYCKRDIQLWRTIRRDSFFKNTKTLVPSFQKLEAIYEKSGRYEEAIKVCEMAMDDMLLSDHDMWLKRYNRLKAKMK